MVETKVVDLAGRLVENLVGTTVAMTVVLLVASLVVLKVHCLGAL